MKKLIVMFAIIGILILAACSETSKDESSDQTDNSSGATNNDDESPEEVSMPKNIPDEEARHQVSVLAIVLTSYLMIVLMATGNTPLMDWNILEGLRSLSATIAVELPESEVGSSHYRLLFLAALILFVFTFAVNALAEWVRQTRPACSTHFILNWVAGMSERGS